MKIAEVVVGLPVSGPFDYLIPENLRGLVAPGRRVRVPFGARRLIGYVVGLKAAADVKRVKPLEAVLDGAALLGPAALELSRRFAEHYGCSRGEAIEAGLPKPLRARKRLKLEPLPDSGPAPDTAAGFSLCHDHGRSARWPFLADKLRPVLAEGRGAIILVPEARSLDDVRQVFQKEFAGRLTVLDNRLSDKELLSRWLAVRDGTFRLVIGTRSAVFAPVRNCAMIIVIDEENEHYKQEQSPFYRAGEVAEMRMRLEGGEAVFVSSTPSVETWKLSRESGAGRICLPADRVSPLELIDLTNYKYSFQSTISFPLQNAVERALTRRDRVLILFNRRGFHTLTRCNACGESLRCPRCETNLIYLYQSKTLICRRCRHSEPLPEHCPRCRSPYLRSVGGGVERLESQAARLFPSATLAVLEGDGAAPDFRADIVIATRAALAHLDRLRPSLIGVVDIDAELNRFDFRSSQRVFSLLIRLRQSAGEKVIVQTRLMDDYCLKAARDLDYPGFYEKELALRREMHLPPFSGQAAIVVRGPQEDTALAQAGLIYEALCRAQEAAGFPDLDILEPQPAVPPKLRDQYRFCIFVKAENLRPAMPQIRQTLKSCRKKREVIVTVDVD